VSPVRHREGLGTFYRALEGAERPGCEGEWWGAAMASAVSALKGEQRGWGGAPFREEEGRRRSQLGFLGYGGVGWRHQGGGYTG
jgi:hypothetical protein